MVELPEGFRPVSQGIPDGFRPATAQPEKEKVQGNYLRGLTQNIAQGTTLGFSDEITGVLVAAAAEVRDILTPGNDGQTFNEVRRDVQGLERESQKAFAEENPKTAFAAEIAGGVATGGVGAAKIAGAKVFQGAKTVAGRVTQKLSAQAASAAPIGAAFGAGVSEGGVGERIKGAAKGAAIAAVASPVLAGVAGTVSRGVKGLTSLFKSSETKAFNRASQQVARAIERDGDVVEVDADEGIITILNKK
jgi:hypothetical protein